ncbi:VF530 family protein [Paracidovorax wautersii]|uniref:VF530 family protein n=1 Tax=Paracidovorax wautersii TaxID=1177982 RepID=UPI0031D4255A
MHDDSAAPGTPPPLATASSSEPAQPRNPLHGVTLEAMVVGLQTYFGWQGLAERIPVRCFQSDPSVPSSLKFLRKTPWAREKVESLYLFMLRDQRRNAKL